MNKTNNLTDFLKDLADGIRTAEGSSEPINPQDFRSRIEALPGGGESGVPIVTTELPVPTEQDAGKVYKVYLPENLRILPVVGKSIGDKIYFDTTKNPVDYAGYNGDSLISISNGTNTYHLSMPDIFELQGVTGYGHCYAVGLASGDMSQILGLAYVYCDVLNVEQFNQMIGSQFGVSITQFGWQTDVIDTSAVADYIVEINNLANWDNIVYLGMMDIEDVEGCYYVGVGVDTLAAGETMPSIIKYDKSMVPEIIGNDAFSGIAVWLMAGNGGIVGYPESLAAAEFIAYVGSSIVLLYANSTSMSVDDFNTGLGAELGLSPITEFGWQGDGTIDTSDLTDTTIVYFNDAQGIFSAAPYFSIANDAKIKEITENLNSKYEELETEYNKELSGNLGNEYEYNYSSSIRQYLFAGRSCTKFIVGNNVTHIGEGAFYNAQITDISLPNSLTYIAQGAFACCRLKTITIPAGITQLPHKAFCGIDDMDNSFRTSLESVLFAENSQLTSIGNSAFESCISLTSINIPNGVTSIGKYAFENCGSLTSINIPNGVTSLGDYAFSRCTSLTSVNIPSGVSRIPDNAFSRCSGLTSVTMQEGVTSIGYCAFQECTSLTSINIPDSVTSIGSSAFHYCSDLTSIVIPKNVKNLNYGVFYYCRGLKNITIYATTPPSFNGEEHAFYGCDSLAAIYVPAESVEVYKAAYGWNKYRDKIQPIVE